MSPEQYNNVTDILLYGWVIATLLCLMVISTEKKKPKRKRTTRKRKTVRG